MYFKGKKLLLDNFRDVLKSYSLDIQDVVRSCILDDIDVEKYINPCRNNAIWLDQIRLAKKEGVPEEFFAYGSGKLPIIRDLYRENLDLTLLKGYNARDLSEIKFAYVAKWIKQGIDFRGIDVSIIPNYLLPSFETGLMQGIDMKKLNTEINYTIPYFENCKRLLSKKLDIEKFIDGSYPIEVLDLMLRYGLMSNNSIYNEIYKYIDPNITIDRIKLYERYSTLGGNLKDVAMIENGEYVLNEETLKLLIEAQSHNVNLIPLLEDGATYKELNLAYQEELLKGERKLSGRLRKKS